MIVRGRINHKKDIQTIEAITQCYHEVKFELNRYCRCIIKNYIDIKLFLLVILLY